MSLRNRTDTLLLLLLLAAVSFFSIAIVNALDRNRRAIARLEKIIAALPQRPLAPSPVSAAADIPQSGNKLQPNAIYFDQSGHPGGIMRSAISSDVGSLNPVTGNEATAAGIIDMCTSTLATRDFAHPEKFVPMIAESWQVSPDNREIKIKLRSGVMWQDFTDPDSGKHVPEKAVTAHDFVFYVQTIRNPQVNAGALRSYFQDLESIKAVSDLELVLVWKKPYFRSLEMTLSLIPLPRHFYCPDNAAFDPEKFNYDHKRNQMIVGCGPYKLIEHVRDQRFVLKRFKNYFGQHLHSAPLIETRILEIVKADNTRFQMLMSGELDELALTAEQWVKRTHTKEFSQKVLTTGEQASDHPLRTGERLRKVKYLANAYFYIGYNLRNELFADRRVRQALTMLCNRQRIVKEVFHDQGKIISGPFFYNSPYYDRQITPWPFDPQQALKLLHSAGWSDSDGDGVLDRNGKKFVFTALQVSGNPVQERILSIFKEDLARAGIDMKLLALEWPIYISKLEKRDFEVCSLGWQLPFESDPYQVWHSSQAEGSNGSNHIGFVNPEADRIIEEIRRTFDVQQRIRLCHQFQQLLHEEQPYTFLLVPEKLQVLSGKLQNVRCFPLGLNSECFWIDNHWQPQQP